MAQDEEKYCVDCGEKMILRVNRNEDRFWGCSAYPICKYTEDYEDDEDPYIPDEIYEERN